MPQQNKPCKRFAICGNMVGEGRRANYCIHCSNTRNRWNEKCREYQKKKSVREKSLHDKPFVKARCKGCGWKGSKYKVKVGLRNYFCPECESDKVELYIPKKKGTSRYAAPVS